MSTSSPLDLNIYRNRIDETRIAESFEDDDFPALGPSFDWRGPTHHMVTGLNASHNSVPEYLKGRLQTQNDPLSQHFTKPQNMAITISPDNTLPIVGQTQQRQNSDSGNPIDRLAEAIAGIASQQRLQMLSPLLKPTTTNTLIFDGKNEQFEIVENLFQTMLKMQPEMSPAMEIIHFHSHF